MPAPYNPLADPNLRIMVHVGNIATQWSNLEHKVAALIWILLGLDTETGKIVTGGLDMLPRINMAINLARHLKAPRPLVNKLVQIRKELQDTLSEERNKAMHGVRFGEADGPLEIEVHRGKGNRQREPLTEDMLNTTGKRLHELSVELHSEITAAADDLRVALLSMAKKIERTVSDELGPPPKGSNSQNS